MTAVMPMRFRATRQSAPRWLTVAWVELVLRLRDTNVPILAACMAAASVLLTPTIDASYAVITFGGLKPEMSAHTSLIAAGFVLSLLILPVYALSLGVGCARERRLNTGATLAATPIDGASVVGGRLIANALLVALFSTIALFLVTAAIAPRYQGVPGITSIGAYLLIVVPAGLCALPVAALMDRYFGGHNAAKAFVTIAFWSAGMVGSLLAWPDTIGFGFLRNNAPSGTAGDFSVGIVSAQNMARISWKSIDLTASFAAERFALLAGVAVACALACLVARTGLMEAITRTTAASAAGTTPAKAAVYLPRLRPVATGPLSAAWAVTKRWFRGSKLIGGLFAISITISLLTESTRIAAGAALLLPLAIANARRISGDTEIRLFERATAAFWQPSPLLFTSLILAVVTAVPVIPALGPLAAMRSLHVLTAICAAALWLTWTCAGMGRPLLGISVYVLAWYLACFTDLPANADLLGLTATTPVSFSGAAILCAGLVVSVFRKDSYASRGPGNI